MDAAENCIDIMTTIGPSLIISGDVTSREDITIHGKVTGKIAMEDGALLIASNAHVEATAQVATLTILGDFRGDIAATNRVELKPTATVRGNVSSPAVVLHDGVMFNGTIAVERRGNAGLRATIESASLVRS